MTTILLTIAAIAAAAWLFGASRLGRVLETRPERRVTCTMGYPTCRLLNVKAARYTNDLTAYCKGDHK